MRQHGTSTVRPIVTPSSPVAYTTQQWHDYGAAERTFTDNLAALVVDDNSAFVRIDLDRNTYKYSLVWWNASVDYPAYLWVAGTVTKDGWSQAFSGKCVQPSRAGSFRTAPTFAIPDGGRYTIDYTIHQRGAYLLDIKDELYKRHSGDVIVA
jgi:hypothetical protein